VVYLGFYTVIDGSPLQKTQCKVLLRSYMWQLKYTIVGYATTNMTIFQILLWKSNVSCRSSRNVPAGWEHCRDQDVEKCNAAMLALGPVTKY